MTDLVSTLMQRRRGFTLEAPFYTDPAIFEADMDVIFGRHWIFVGVEPDVPEAGDVMTVEIGRNSVLVIRDDDEQTARSIMSAAIAAHGWFMTRRRLSAIWFAATIPGSTTRPANSSTPSIWARASTVRATG